MAAVCGDFVLGFAVSFPPTPRPVFSGELPLLSGDLRQSHLTQVVLAINILAAQAES